MQHSKDITSAKLAGTRERPDEPEGVCQVFFRIPVDLDIRIRHAIAERRCTKRALWLVAMHHFLGEAVPLDEKEERDEAAKRTAVETAERLRK